MRIMRLWQHTIWILPLDCLSSSFKLFLFNLNVLAFVFVLPPNVVIFLGKFSSLRFPVRFKTFVRKLLAFFIAAQRQRNRPAYFTQLLRTYTDFFGLNVLFFQSVNQQIFGHRCQHP